MCGDVCYIFFNISFMFKINLYIKMKPQINIYLDFLCVVVKELPWVKSCLQIVIFNKTNRRVENMNNMGEI